MKNNQSLSRFEIVVEDQIVFANYRLKDNVLYIDYVESPTSLRGTGSAGKLMEEIAKKAQAEKLKIIPICGYAVAWMKKHRQYHDLLDTAS